VTRFRLFLALAVVSAAFAQTTHAGNNPFPAYRIMDNLYYVGTQDIASYLIVTPKGHFLLNSGYEDTPALIRASVEKLGFKIADVKILLNSQAHSDHVAGQAALQKLTGAKIYSSEREAGVLESGGKTDTRFGREVTYPPVHVDHTVSDGERVTLGGLTLTAHLTPGHSIGCTTWTMQATDAGKIYDVVFVGGTSINPGVRLVDRPTYPGIAEDYQRTFQTLRSLKCDVFLGAHGGYYGMIEKYKRMEKGAQPNPFIDPAGYRAYVDAAEAQFLDRLSAEKHGPLRLLEQHPDGSVTSSNWSGYAVTGEVGSVTAVEGSWVVPTATCDGRPRNSGASFWVGIDGYTSATVEQTGTDSDCSKGSPRYYAWYEFFPDAGITIKTISVEPGDVMSASVVYNGTEFTATITDERTQETFTASKAVPSAKRDSAEWIAEDNAYVFTDFGTVLFGQDETGVAGTCEATVSSKTAAIGGFPSYHPIAMVGSKAGSWLAVPSALSIDGTSFWVEWH
jgi:metallo-beta-lactamase class B